MPATREEIIKALAQIVNEVAGIPIDDVQVRGNFIHDLDVDALSLAEVAEAAEARFALTIADEDVPNLKTVGDMADYILRHQG